MYADLHCLKVCYLLQKPTKQNRAFHGQTNIHVAYMACMGALRDCALLNRTAGGNGLL
jgi:hypothetical protein